MSEDTIHYIVFLVFMIVTVGVILWRLPAE